ncbi:hypothetical protein [Mammaliicoccus sciuri]|uniref:hypothetical protein n=1 Tax=Mammaliicoccus sciuri TaxID=1296 RepID=UPI00195357F8|nr:hypothetical protein [Mammaliicoccus sciuri]
MNKLAKITGVAMLSVGLLAGCQSKEEKLLQGTWENSNGYETLTFDENTVATKFVDGSGSEREFEVKKGKKDRHIIIIEKYKKDEDDVGKDFDSETEFKVSKDGKTLWRTVGNQYYEKIEDEK